MKPGTVLKLLGVVLLLIVFGALFQKRHPEVPGIIDPSVTVPKVQVK
jgi:hypothetical protein